MNLDSISATLWACPYPDQMECIECGIAGAGFYPGARGFGEESPEGGIMLLGRDFGTNSYYERLSGIPARDETSSTWRRTKDIYLAAFEGLPVWCTNYLLGVRKSGSAVGNVKNLIDPLEWKAFEAYCWLFLQAQVLLQRPHLVVILGVDNRDDLSIGGRFGGSHGRGLRYSFANADGQHSAVVTFADHPHSLIPVIRQNAARAIAQELRHVYEVETLVSRIDYVRHGDLSR